MRAVFKAFRASNTDMKVNRRAKHIAQHDEDEYDVDDDLNCTMVIRCDGSDFNFTLD